ncbi:hypothetical protein DPMN_072418 [Dreissena polymorpha]|uniref:Uncharacterized protein n=1 Tax=Dreissena polymorpha TaxID=45954 RepID=A0A9D3Z4C9_DREPO|nr:hypothetical protein DPMN_072418 [Dreissena polymorpha]
MCHVAGLPSDDIDVTDDVKVAASDAAAGHMTSYNGKNFDSYYGGNGANTGQLAYLRRHFHRKRWH